MEKYSSEDVAISALVLEEVIFGILKVTSNVKKLKDHPIFEIPIIEFTKQDAIFGSRNRI